MELNDLKTIAAASLLGGLIAKENRQPKPAEITNAVRIAGLIWTEVIRQDREG